MREIEAELWCPQCQLYYAKIWRVLAPNGIWVHEREPKQVPVLCQTCNGVIERRA